MHQSRIMGIMVYDRIKEAGKTQEVLSKYSQIILTRLGFHELSRDVCSRVGTILLVLQGKPEVWDKLQAELEEIGGVEVQIMKFRNLVDAAG
ncbi:MAG: hypothetical protein EA393_07600 [Bacteroidetes bacterium]|nr:MAG: hypothetical protein EA393_07600 [Bacteroidota bacterium]